MAFVVLEVLRVGAVLWLSNAVGALYCLLAAPDAHAHVALVPLALASGGTATLHLLPHPLGFPPPAFAMPDHPLDTPLLAANAVVFTLLALALLARSLRPKAKAE